VLTTTPVLDRLLSTRVNAAGSVPELNSRFPLPRITGKSQTWKIVHQVMGKKRLRQIAAPVDLNLPPVPALQLRNLAIRHGESCYFGLRSARQGPASRHL